VNQKITPFWLLFVLTGLNLVNYLDRYVLSAVRTPLATEFGLSYGESGRIFTTFMIGYFFTSPLFGYLGDRVSRKGLIAAGIFVWSLGTVLTGWAAGFGQLILFRVLVGVGEASYASVSPSLISDSYGPKRRNNALTVFYLAIPVGTAMGFILGGAIAARWGWRYAFLWAGAPGLLLAFVLLPFREPKRGEAEAVEGQTLTKPGVRDVFGLFKNGRYMLVVWGYVAYTFALGAFAFWGPTFLERVHHLATDKAGGFMGGVIIFSGLVGTLMGGFTATRWQQRNPAGYAWMLGCAVVLAVPTSFLALISSTVTLTLFLLGLSIFLLFLCTGPVNTLILETVPVNLRSSAMALSIFLIHLFGDLWSPEIVGRLADHLGNDLRSGLLILPFFLSLAALFWMSLAWKIVKADGRLRSSRTKERVL